MIRLPNNVGWIFPLLLLSTLISSGCMSKRTIQANGLKFVKIGDIMPDDSMKRLGGKSLRDTVFDQSGYSWRAKVLDYKDGKVYVEEDFWGQNQVNRIRIESQVLRAKSGISVGMTMGDLKQISTKWEALFLVDYDLLDLILPHQPSIHYLVKESKTLDRSSSEAPIVIEEIPSESLVVAIVVM